MDHLVRGKMAKLFYLFLLLFWVTGCTSDYMINESPDIPPSDVKPWDQPEEPPPTHYITDMGPVVDVLVILDTSCSMVNDDDKIDNLSMIPLDMLDRPDVNWRLGITSADIDYIDDLTEIDLRNPYPNEDLILAIDELKKPFGGPVGEQSLDVALKIYNETTWFRQVFTIFVIMTDENDQSDVSANIFEASWPTRFDMVVIGGEIDSGAVCGAIWTHKLDRLATKKIDICDEYPWSIFN